MATGTVNSLVSTLNSNFTRQDRFVKASGTINATFYSIDVPSAYCCGLFVANINGAGNTLGYFRCNNGTITIGLLGDTTHHLDASYSNNKIIFTNVTGTSIRDITVIIG